MDSLLRRVTNTPEQLKKVLEEIIAAPTGNDFVTFEITDIASIAVAKKYAGIGAALAARIKNTKTPFSIDFGVGDVIVPNQEKYRIPTQLDDFAAPTVNTYSLETTIAEKIDAILSRMEFSSRMKGYYDIYYLANKFDFDGAILTEALRKTFENRGNIFTVEQFEQVMAFDNDDAMQKKWKAFCRKIDTKTEDYSTVLRTIKEFLTKPFIAAVNEVCSNIMLMENHTLCTVGGWSLRINFRPERNRAFHFENWKSRSVTIWTRRWTPLARTSQ